MSSTGARKVVMQAEIAVEMPPMSRVRMRGMVDAFLGSDGIL